MFNDCDIMLVFKSLFLTLLKKIKKLYFRFFIISKMVYCE